MDTTEGGDIRKVVLKEPKQYKGLKSAKNKFKVGDVLYRVLGHNPDHMKDVSFRILQQHSPATFTVVNAEIGLTQTVNVKDLYSLKGDANVNETE